MKTNKIASLVCSILPKWIPRGSFAKNVTKMLSGNAVAQAMAVVAMPLLTRLYSPGEFGVFAVFLSLTTILAAFLCLRYEVAIVLPKSDIDACQLFYLALMIATVISVCGMGVVYMFKDAIITLLDLQTNPDWIYVVPGAALLIAFYQALYYWLNRNGEYGSLAFSQVVRTGTASLTQGCLGLCNFFAGGLIFGNIVGYCSSSMMLLNKVVKNKHLLFRIKPSYSALKKLLVEYGDFPKYNVWSSVIRTALIGLPSLMLAFYFDSSVVGFYALGYKMLNVPTGLLSRSVNDVFYQKTSSNVQKGNSTRGIVRKTIRNMFVLSIVPVLALLFFGPTLFSVIFGEKWVDAGRYVQIMAPLFLFKFVCAPLPSIFLIYNKQIYNLIIQCITLILTLLAFWMGGMRRSVDMALYLYTGVLITRYMMELILAFKLSGTRFSDLYARA